MKIKLILIVPLIFLMTGCFNYSELNEMSIVSGISIDREKDNYSVSFLITNAQKPNTNSKDNSSDMTVLNGKGKSITEAINDIDLKNPKKYYLGHLSSLIVSKEVAKEMHDITDFFMRNPELLKKFYIIVSKDKARDVLSIISPQEILPSENIISNLKELSDEQAIIHDKIYSEYIIDVLEPGKDPVLPVIEINGKTKNADDSDDIDKTEIKTNIEISSIALFKDYNLKAIADITESRGINVINNNANKLYLRINCDNGYMIGLINNVKTKTDYKLSDNIEFNIKTTGSITLREITCHTDLNNPKNLKKITNEFEKELKRTINKGVKFAKKNSVDVFGFGNLIYKKDYNYWIKNKKDWHNRFSNINTNVTVNLSLSSIGGARKE